MTPQSGVANMPTSTGRDMSMPICVLFMPISSKKIEVKPPVDPIVIK